MMRLPRIVSLLTLVACLVSAPAHWNAARADDNGASAVPAPAPSGDNGASATPAPAPSGDNGASATPAPAAATPSDNSAAPAPETTQAKPTVADLVESFWYYGKIARYDLAVAAGRQILASGADPRAILEAFENVAGRKGDSIDIWMLRWRSLGVSDDAGNAVVQQMRDVANKLNDQINLGYAARGNDPEYIRQTISEMSTGSRAYDNNMPRLDRSGEVVVKVIIDLLRNPDQAQYYDTCRRILRDLGRKALNPLLAATEMKDYDTLVDVVSALGDIGYPDSIPYLDRLLTDPRATRQIHSAARNALLRMGVANPAALNPAEEFYRVAEKFYYHRSDFQPATDKIAYIWYWTGDQGLTRKDVPSRIFDDLLAMRAAEYSMKLDASDSDAVSLWLAANTKREVDLPPGQTDVTHAGDPDANFYNVSAGVSYLDRALSRALHDRNAAVVYKLCQSLQNIIGQKSLSGSAGDPLTQALYFPNRQVRYEAAFALAQSLPSKPFPGSDRVVPLLVEAIEQTSKPGILIVAPAASDTASAADLRGAVQSLGYPVVVANDPTDGANAAISLPTVDLIVISEDSDVRKMIDLEQNIARLQGASILVLTRSAENPYVVAAATDPLMNADVFPPHDGLTAALKDYIDAARQRSGTAVLSDADATAYALQAAALLEKLAITRGHALDVSVAEGGLLSALSDSRPEIAKAAGHILSTLNSASAQNGLAMKANDESTPPDIRVSLYKSVANSAKHEGNQLTQDAIAALEKVVADGKNPGIRAAAAEARGALDLPANQARTLILLQSHL